MLVELCKFLQPPFDRIFFRECSDPFTGCRVLAIMYLPRNFKELLKKIKLKACNIRQTIKYDVQLQDDWTEGLKGV